LYVARGPVDQLQTDLTLQFAHATAHCGLRQTDFIAGPAEAPQLGYFNEDAQLPQRYVQGGVHSAYSSIAKFNAQL